MPVDPKKLTEPECEFRSRLRYPDAGDTWWDYGATDEEAEDAALSIKMTYLAVGRAYFQRFSLFPDHFTRVAPDSFESRTIEVCPPAMTDIRSLLALARIYDHLQNRAYARQFAEIGLQKLAKGCKAIGLKMEFEKYLGA